MTELMKSCNFLLFYSWVEIQIAPAHLHFLKRCCLRIDVVAASMSAKRNSASAVLLLKLLTSWQKSVEEFFSDVKTFVCSVLCLLASLSFSCFDSNLQQSLPEIQRREFESLSSVTTLHFSAGKSLFLLEVSRFWSDVDSVPSSVNVFSTNSGEEASSCSLNFYPLPTVLFWAGQRLNGIPPVTKGRTIICHFTEDLQVQDLNFTFLQWY